MPLCRNEESLFRELNALAGDLTQIAAAITRNHEERVKEAEVSQKRLEEQRPGRVMAVAGMRGFDSAGLLTDLIYIRQRIELLTSYLIDKGKLQPQL